MRRSRKKRWKEPQRGRGEHKRTTHHITPTSRNGKDDYSNKIYPPEHLHVAYHMLFNNMTPNEIMEFLKTHWFDVETSKYKNPNKKDH